MHLKRSSRTIAACAAALTAALAATASASAPPVGPLPAGPVTSIVTKVGSLVAVALPSKPASTGLVWRQARDVNPKVLAQVSEGEMQGNVVVIFKAVGAGRATVVFALTRGETPKAIEARTYVVRVT
jgi:hypothetical protein